MKFIKVLLCVLCLGPVASHAASSDFMLAAQLLAAAKDADIQQVQALVNNGANVNFVDSTGLSIVCTALLNNDVRAAQILQMYGADASKCDNQIKKYNNKTKPRGSGGLFSGLSSAQSITLTAAGAAVVVGGLLLLTDVFDPGNDNESASSGGNRPDNNGGNNGGENLTAAFTIPYGPAMPTAANETENYVTNLNLFSPGDDSVLADDFALMTDGDKQNYLLMMHGYSPLARGYFGMRTLRNSSTREPLDISGVNWFSEPVMGGRPVNVALITSNGVNANNYANGVDALSSLGDTLLPWTTTNGTVVGNTDSTMVSSKYFNNKVVLGSGENTVADAVTMEDAQLLVNFDLANWGTAVNNANATNDDNLLAKVVGGRTSGYADADYVGFMPNGQMTIFRTGNDMEMADATSAESGNYTLTDEKLTQIQLFGETLTVVQDGNTFVATNGDQSKTYHGYIGTNGLMYIDSNADGKINQAYTMADNGVLTLKLASVVSDYLNYRALAKAVQLYTAGDLGGGRSRVDVIANSSVIEPLRSNSVETIDDILALGADDRDVGIVKLVNKYYNQVDEVDENGNDAPIYPGTDASNVFSQLGASFQPLVIFSTGAFETDSAYAGKTLGATFENAVPLAYDNAEHYFMSIVGVGLTGNGTAGTTSVSGYAPSGKIALTQWPDAENEKYYKARMCGFAGTGAGDVDPWCFAAAGKTDQLAVSSAAGAVGAVKSAFSYLNNSQIFTLLALTADGPFLASTADGTAFSKENLVAYLDSMYMLPGEYQSRVDSGMMDYLSAFKEVFGYGLINLERATTPGKSIYFFDGNSIVSTDGNAYWRAASNTMFRPSTALNLAGKKIRAPFFDVLQSSDGTMTLPRVWENEFAFGTSDERGLYMGDVLGELKTTRDNSQRVRVGNMGLSMAFSERAYDDNMNGLDNLSLDYMSGNWMFGASYQRYLIDGASRFDGMANPVLGLASNAVVSDVRYSHGAWSFGARAFSGAITDEGLLENDPTISAQYIPATLGLVQGAQSDVSWQGARFAVTTSLGTVNETNTLLGARTDGLLNMGAGDTVYVDTVAKYNVTDYIDVTARATFAKTQSDALGQVILGMSDIYSNAFAIGANVGNFEFSISQPLAITSGALKYAYADYDVVNVDDNNYRLDVVDTYVQDLPLRPDDRELRLVGTYRHKFGEFTDGALGFIYRINPNHTDEFGNESIFMMKMTHRLGI
ncbi:MAG: hypothetical protein J6K82_00955 [Alphaproteobacteria bacterium]|nr:hypothetical protein [Alphaproteobacteria bacterium]